MAPTHATYATYLAYASVPTGGRGRGRGDGGGGEAPGTRLRYSSYNSEFGL